MGHDASCARFNAGADKDLARNDDVTPLILAAQNEPRRGCALLLDAGPQGPPDNDDDTHDHRGLEGDAVVRTLLDAGADKERTNTTAKPRCSPRPGRTNIARARTAVEDTAERSYSRVIGGCGFTGSPKSLARVVRRSSRKQGGGDFCCVAGQGWLAAYTW